jgi:hypothetical protein
VEPSIFLDFHLPNAATWLYFSLILTLTLFFQFARPFCVRNLDLLTLFLLSPGFLLLQEAHHLIDVGRTERGERELILGYSWLLAGSAYWFVRAVIDVGLVRAAERQPEPDDRGPRVPRGRDVRGAGVGRAAADLRPVRIGPGRAAAGPHRTGAGTGDRGGAAGPNRGDPERVARRRAVLGRADPVHDLPRGGRRGAAADRRPALPGPAAGIGMATLYLLVPYTAFDIGRQLHHVWPTAFLVWAVYCYRRPVLSGWLLGLAAGTALFPALLFPLWLGFYARRGAGRFARSFVGAVAVSVGITGLVTTGWSGDATFGIATTLSLPDWQPWKEPTAESIWTGAHWAYRLPLFVLYVAFLVGVSVWPSPKNLSHLISLSAALLIGVQFWHADRGGVYVLWYLPLLVMLVFRPNLSAAEPPNWEPSAGLVSRIAGAAWRRVRPVRPEPPNQLAV